MRTSEVFLPPPPQKKLITKLLPFNSWQFFFNNWEEKMLSIIQDRCNFFRGFRKLVGTAITHVVVEIQRKHQEVPNIPLFLKYKEKEWCEQRGQRVHRVTGQGECLCTHYTVFTACPGFPSFYSSCHMANTHFSLVLFYAFL